MLLFETFFCPCPRRFCFLPEESEGTSDTKVVLGVRVMEESERTSESDVSH